MMRMINEKGMLVTANEIETLNIESKDIQKVIKFMEENNIGYTHHPEAWAAYAQREARFNIFNLMSTEDMTEEDMAYIEKETVAELMNNSEDYLDENRIAFAIKDIIKEVLSTKLDDDSDIEEITEVEEVNISPIMMGDKLYFVLGAEDKNSSIEYTSEVTAEYKGSGGYDSDIEEATEANLVIGKRYPVSKISIHSWNTDIYLLGIKGYFNSCMFTFYNSKGEIIDIVDTYRSYFGY